MSAAHRWLIENLIFESGTILTASSAAGGFPVSRLRNPLRKRRWRSDTLEPSVTINLGEAGQTVRAFACVGHNLSETATVDVETSEDDVTYTLLGTIQVTDALTGTGFGEGEFGLGGFGGVNLENVLNPPDVLSLFFSSTANQYFRVTFHDTANSDGFVEVGTIFIGNYFETMEDADYGWNLSLTDESEVALSMGKTHLTNTKPIFRQLEFTLSHLDAADAFSSIANIVRTQKILHSDVYLIFLSDAKSKNTRDATSLYGRFVNAIDITHKARNVFAAQFVFEESL